MGGKTRINGTSYSIIGGRTRVNGTTYTIKSGKVMIGSTGYTVNIVPPVEDANDSLSDGGTDAWQTEIPITEG